MLLAEWSNVHPFPHGVNGSGASTPFYMDYTTQVYTVNWDIFVSIKLKKF